MFYYLVVLPPCLTQPLSTSLMFCWVAGQLWLLVDGQLLPLGVGWQDYQSFAHIHTPPTTPCLPCLFCSPHVPVHCAHGAFSPQPVHSLTTILGLLAPHAQELGGFSLTRTFSGAPRVAEAPTHCNSRPCCCFVHPRAKSELFSPHAGPLLLESSRRKSGMSFRAFFCWVQVFPHAQDVWVVFPM